MKRSIALAVLVLALSPAAAGAVTLVNPDGTPSVYQRWANQVPVPTVRARVVVSSDMSRCAGSGACEVGDTIYYDGQADIDALAHGLGHAFDSHVLSDASRAAFEPLMGYPTDTPWFACGYDPGTRWTAGCVDYSDSPQEAFANAYANCTNRDGNGDVDTGPGGGGALARGKRALCRLIASAARAHPGEVDWPPPSKRRLGALRSGGSRRLVFAREPQ